MTTLLKLCRPQLIKRKIRVLSCVFLLDNFDAWADLSIFMASILPYADRVKLVWSFLRLLDPDDIVATAEAVLPTRTPSPIAPLFSHTDEAEFWADTADPEAIEAYCLACFERMAPARQVAFLNYVQQGTAKCL